MPRASSRPCGAGAAGREEDGEDGEDGIGIIAFSPLGQGMLTDRYLGGIPENSRAAKDGFLKKDFISDENMARVKALNEIYGGTRNPRTGEVI